MVLVDPATLDQTARFERATPAISRLMAWATDTQIAQLSRCAAALRSGSLRKDGPDPEGCLASRPWPEDYPPRLRRALDDRIADASPETIAATMDTFASLLAAEAPNSRLVIDPARDYGDMPLVVLTRDYDGDAAPEVPREVVAEFPAQYAEWRRGHAEYVALSTRGEDRVAPGSTHGMVTAMPEVVIDAILDVVRKVRASAAEAP